MKGLQLTATLDVETVYRAADFVVIVTLFNNDSTIQHFDTSAVESVIGLVMKNNLKAIMMIKSTIPVGYTKRIRKRLETGTSFSALSFEKIKMLYENVYPTKLVAIS